MRLSLLAQRGPRIYLGRRVTGRPSFSRSNRGRQRSSEIALARNNNRFEAQPTGHRVELGREGWRDLTGIDMSLDVRRQNEQTPLLAVSLQINSGNQPIPQQERENVVPPPALWLGHEDLNPILKVEKPGRARRRQITGSNGESKLAASICFGSRASR